MHNHDHARAHVMIAASTGYWGLQRLPFRFLALFFWLVYGPLMLRMHGYVPRGRIWTGRSLPRDVFLQWREWCLHPNHFGPALENELRESHFAAVRTPLLACGFEDDPIATHAAVEALLRFYPLARAEQRWTRPADIGVRKIGHHGFFAERHKDSLWRPVLDWIDAQAG
jgi:predicted alpha/beta hydrolase